MKEEINEKTKFNIGKDRRKKKRIISYLVNHR